MRLTLGYIAWMRMSWKHWSRRRRGANLNTAQQHQCGLIREATGRDGRRRNDDNVCTNSTAPCAHDGACLENGADEGDLAVNRGGRRKRGRNAVREYGERRHRSGCILDGRIGGESLRTKIAE